MSNNFDFACFDLPSSVVCRTPTGPSCCLQRTAYDCRQSSMIQQMLNHAKEWWRKRGAVEGRCVRSEELQQQQRHRHQLNASYHTKLDDSWVTCAQSFIIYCFRCIACYLCDVPVFCRIEALKGNCRSVGLMLIDEEADSASEYKWMRIKCQT